MDLFGRGRHTLSLLVLLIFITFFGNTLTRHHIRHYKDRLKRQQGAHLYLAGSYVYDGGDGPDAGPWTEWSSPSPCSRTCGGGVSTQYRQCQPGYSCQGPTARHFSCNTQDCPDTGDFRAQQCSEYDPIPFEGVLYQWIPYTKAPNVCELNCMPRGERFYYRHKAEVTDGTRCNDENLDVCVQGKCQSVGCDMMLGSIAREDKCRRCGGDGSTCTTVTGRLDMQDLQVGYNDILLIPTGATNILVQEIAPSNNYLAVRNTSGHYHLNGNWRIDFPRTMEFAGCKFHYERYPQGLAAPDRISCLGPIEEALFIVLLFQDKNVGVDYEYSLPTNIQPGSEDESYAWTFDQFTLCTATCGGGTQYRNVTCAGRKTLEPVDKSLCDAYLEPVSSQTCADVPCEGQWVPYPWGPCSAPCGERGIQTRQIACQQIVANGYPALVNDDECERVQPKPSTEQPCNQGTVCAKWHVDHWKPCDHLCGEGRQTRQVTCYREEGKKIETLDDYECAINEPKPETEKRCYVRPCEGVDWVVSEWSGCEECGLTNETRRAQCASASGQIFSDEICETEKKPELVRKCGKPNASCEYLWYASQWSKCSAKCGEGVQTRTIFCGTKSKNKEVKQVADDKCDASKQYEKLKRCIGEHQCTGEWYSGPWSKCSKSCGGGERTKKVLCLRDLQVVNPAECGSDKIIFSQEECNKQPCSDDSIIPTDVTKSIDESELTKDTESSGNTETGKTTDETGTVSDAAKTKEVTEVEKTTVANTDVDKTTETSIDSDKTTDSGKTTDSEKTTDLEKTSQSSKSPKSSSESPDDDNEYVIEPDDECEDGEWVNDEGEPEVYSDEETEPTESSKSSDTSLSMDDLMLSDSPSTGETDGSSITDTEITGSGDTEIISSSGTTETGGSTESTLEGSGDTSSTSFTASSATDTSIDLESSSQSSNATVDVIGTSYISKSTSENTSGSSEINDVTTESSVDSSDSSTDSSSSSNSTSSPSFENTESSSSSVYTDTTETTESTSKSSSSSESSTSDFSSSSTTQISPSTSDFTTEISESTTIDSTDTDTSTSESLESAVGSKGSSTSESSGDSESITEFISSTETSTAITGSSETITEFTGSTKSSTEFTGITESTTEFIGITESGGSTESTTEFTNSTESTSELTGSTETSGFTDYDIWSSSTSSSEKSSYATTFITEIFETRKPRMCKRKKEKDCHKSEYGCCWDNITLAEGPFDKGCPTPRTCKESKFGCCEDGVSAAFGRKFKGCPPTYCNETLFGCCPDKKTSADGPKNQGCPPPPPKCLKAKYGCCKDNVTIAKGPKQKGCKKEPKVEDYGNCSNSTYGCCPDGVKTAKGEYFKGCDIFKKNCNESYFRCCPDGVKSAKGPNYRGCDVPCANNTFGCCPDGITPAHGYSEEGCCLSSSYGCCPDNINPARGPNLEGCGCQYSPYNCCPDNKTPARGSNNEGCGCKFTDHGCCPDDFTPAAGPDYQGCQCNTYQFGCCPDGVTIAKGPHQQGCGCRNTEFGCCSDDQTPAQGPNLAGCGCDSTKFGCCLDGTTEAVSDNFEGCEEVPVNHQESCGLSKERGPCRNYTVKWFFDMDYGGCSRFWYGGCEGNNNRFKSKEECDGICVKPEGSERCNLPKVPGPCEGYYPQWFYDSERKHCAQFVYGGCLGNNNRFETREECTELCARDSSVDACDQPREEGPCKGNYIRWYFDKDSKSCQQFRYGGCKPNNNNFPTEGACKQQCANPNRRKDHCSLPRAQGNCTEKEPRWYYDIPERRCVPFYYSGCNGNDNNFISSEACETDCPREIEKDMCHLPAEVGDCANYVDRWYYDTREKACRQFYYGGCGGNGNNFQTQDECQARCTPREEPPPRPVYTNNRRPDDRLDDNRRPDERYPKPIPEPGQFQTEFCLLPNETGQCQQYRIRYFYDKNDGVCKSFTYSGCGANQNNFESIEECIQYCDNAQDLCSLPQTVGPCNGEYEQFFYDARTDSCNAFTYGGCGGNHNRFQDKESCEQRCRRTLPDKASHTEAPPELNDAVCYEPADVGNCTDSQSAFFYDASTRTCTPFTYTGCGGNANRYSSEEQCERQCGRFRGQDVCNMPRDSGPCRGYFIKYYYDKNVGRCGQFAYGGCQGNGNRFSSDEECEFVCVTHEDRRPNVTSNEICRLPVDGGSCNDGYHKRWYFDFEKEECVAFIFSGCGGNFNNFKTFQSCIDLCRNYLTVTEPPYVDPSHNVIEPHSCQAMFDECATLRCPYGIEAYVDENNCNRCQCYDPCSNMDCPANKQCAIDLNRNRTSTQDPNFVAVCREVSKEGECPNLPPTDQNCEQECHSDAECALDLKCCPAGCSTACVVPATPPVEIPAELVTQAYLPAFTDYPVQEGYAPPSVDVETYEPEVQGLLGDHVVLRCAMKGSPTPKIMWSKDNLIIDGTQAKYRIKLDQSLQIITLHKTDSGIYLCTADNSIGQPVTNQIRLEVVDSDPRPATILSDDEQPHQVVSLNAPASLNCLALGYPFPAVTWWKDDSLIPLKTTQFEVRKDYSLLINSVQLHDLGIYTCQAYNGIGKAASWSVTVQAKGPYYNTNPTDEKYMRFIIEVPVTPKPPEWVEYPYRPRPPVFRPTPESYFPPSYVEPNPDIDPNEIVPDIDPHLPAFGSDYNVPVQTNITVENPKFPIDGQVEIPCLVIGNPKPQVQWYKDGVPVYHSDHIHISEDNRLTIEKATKSDSGSYQCEASNSHSKSSSSVVISVDATYVHPNCKDNRFLANCALIVKARYCTHKYYAKFCCKSCTEAGLLPVEGAHLYASGGYDKTAALGSNLV